MARRKMDGLSLGVVAPLFFIRHTHDQYFLEMERGENEKRITLSSLFIELFYPVVFIAAKRIKSTRN